MIRTLPRWLVSWLYRFCSGRTRVQRRPSARRIRPMLMLLEERSAPTSLATVSPIELAPPPYFAYPDKSMASTTGETRKIYDWSVPANREPLRLLLPSPRKVEEGFISRNTPPEQPVLLRPFGSRAGTEALDALFDERPRPAHTPRLPVNPVAPNPPTLAGSGGGGGGSGASTPNAAGGGSSAAGGGSGPGVTNANQFLTAYLNMVGSALNLNAAAPPRTAATAPPHAAINHAPAPPAHAPAIPDAGGPMKYRMTAPSLTATSSALLAVAPANGTMTAQGPPVLDLNDGITLPTKYSIQGTPFPISVPLNTFSTWSENLLAQSTGTVLNYSWNVSQAPDLTNVSISGPLNSNLQGTWVSFIGTPRTDKITVTETLLGNTMVSTTLTYIVAGTDSPAFSPSRPTSYSTWPTVITPDTMTSDQPTMTPSPFVSVGLADGSVQTEFAMPSYNPNADPFSLVYNSLTANPQPIFQVRYQEPASPVDVTAQLTFNGVQSPAVDEGIGEPGDLEQYVLQADATGLATGRYPWQINVGGNQYSGYVDIVNQANSPFGAGWTPGNVEQLVSVSGGAMIVNPDGTSLFFAGSGGSFTTPAGDFSTLVQNQDGSYTRTLPDGTQINFNSGGLQTSIVDTDGNITSYAYTGGLLTGITDMDGQTVTLTYSGGKLTSILDPAGRSATLTYNTTYPNQLASITDPGSNLWQYGYNPSNDLTSLTDPNNNGRFLDTSIGYNSYNRVSAVGRPDNITVSVTPWQSAVGQVASADQALYTDADNRTWGYGMDWRGFGANVQVMDPVGDASLVYVDGNGLPWMSADGIGQRERAFFDSKGNVTKDVAADNTFWQYSYNNFSEVTQATDPLGNITTYSYNSKGDLTNIIDALLNTTTFGYNTKGFVTSITDPLLHTTTFGYNALNLLTTITNALSQTATLGYDTAGDLTSSTDARGFVATYGYNTMGWQTSATLPVDGTRTAVYTYSYDSIGNRTQELTPSGDRLNYGYDLTYNLTSIFDAFVGQTTINYDANGNETSETNPASESMSYGYDAAGRRTSVTDSLRNTLTYTYNAAGQLASVTDPLQRVTTYTYTPTGQVASVTDPRNGVTKYGYNLAGDLTSLTDPDNNQTTFGYNALHQLTVTTDPLGHQTTNAYNAGGLLTATTDRDGRTIDYGYDALNRLSSETWAGGNYTATYGYDANSNLTVASDPFSTYSYSYNQANQLTGVDNLGTPGVPHVVLTYGYDTSGNRTSLADSLGGSISYGFDQANRLTSLALSLNGTLAAQITMGYNGASQLTGLTRTSPGGDTIASTLSYDSDGRLTNILHSDTTKTLTLANYTYGYDNASQLTSYQDANSSLSYGYDADGELTSASGTLNGTGYSVSYGYDANGNRNMPGYTTGTGNRLASDGTYNYTYDNEGNTLTQTNIATGSVTYYTWDYRNRLTEVQVKDSHGNLLQDEKFTYDVHNNRIGTWLNGTQRLWTVYDGANPYMDFAGGGTLIERYLTNPNALSEFYGQVNASGTPQWFLTDNINSVRQVIDTGGNSLDAIAYDPYGQIINQTNSANKPRLLYTGGAYDSVTGTYGDGEREEDPGDGRWLSQDPIAYDGGDTDLYRYVGNSPLNAADPAGLYDPRDPTNLGGRFGPNKLVPYVPYPKLNPFNPGVEVYDPPAASGGGSTTRMNPADIASRIIGSRTQQIGMTSGIRGIIQERFPEALKPETQWRVERRAKVWVRPLVLSGRTMGKEISITVSARNAPAGSMIEVYFDGQRIAAGKIGGGGTYDIKYTIPVNLHPLNPNMGRVNAADPPENNGYEIQAIIRPPGEGKGIIYGYARLPVYP